MTSLRICSALLGVLALSACGQAAVAPSTPGARLQVSDVARVEPPADVPVDAAAADIATFGHDLLVQLEPAGNVVISPASIATAFAMLRPAARGATAEEIDAVMHFQADRLGPTFNALTRGWETGEPATDDHPDLAIANALWAKEGLTLEPSYLDAVKTDFGTGVRTVDFTSPDAKKEIDAWVREETRDRIEELFDEIDPDTTLVLANAVYLKATWEDQFDAAMTREADFTLADGSVVQAETMQADGPRDYAIGDWWTAVRLPYATSELSMWVLLPDEDADLAPIDLLDPAVLAEAAAAAQSRDVHLTLPRWDFQTDETLHEPLQGLGMVIPFTGEADFSAAGPLGYISQVIHRADITVDEKGTEAAAVTGIAMEESAPQVSPLAFEADRPFAFAIVDDTTGAPIFEGVVADPTAGS